MKSLLSVWITAALVAVSMVANAAAPAAPAAATAPATPAVAAPAAPDASPASTAPVAPHKVKRESNTETRAGYDLMKARKYAEAISHFEKAVQIDELNKVAWNNLGTCQLKLYEAGAPGTAALDAALAAFQKVAAIDPAYHPENLTNVQALVAQEKAWADATAKRAGQPARTVAATGDYRSYRVAGEAAEQEGDFAFAAANYEKAEAVAGTPKGKGSAANLQGLLALRHRDAKAAVEHLKRATSLDPTNKYAWNNLGVALLRLYDAGAGGKELVEAAVAAFAKVGEIDSAYKSENLSDATALLTELGGPSAPAAESASATPAADSPAAGNPKTAK
jgi:tetratricopeptide (TPR) repeat protein